MWIFRVGKLSHWTKQDPTDRKKKVLRDPNQPHDVGRAVRDLTPRSGENLSVYQASAIEVGSDIAFLYAVTVRPRPRDMDFILIPDESLAGFTCVSTPSFVGAPSLRELHHEIHGLEIVARRQQLAIAVLQHAQTAVVRIRERELVQRARALPPRDEARTFLAGEWPAILAA